MARHHITMPPVDISRVCDGLKRAQRQIDRTVGAALKQAANAPAAPLVGLRARRTAAGVTQATAGKWIGVTKQGFAKLEAGSSPLDIRRAQVIAERLECRIEDLL